MMLLACVVIYFVIAVGAAAVVICHGCDHYTDAATKEREGAGRMRSVLLAGDSSRRAPNNGRIRQSLILLVFFFLHRGGLRQWWREPSATMLLATGVELIFFIIALFDSPCGGDARVEQVRFDEEFCVHNFIRVYISGGQLPWLYFPPFYITMLLTRILVLSLS